MWLLDTMVANFVYIFYSIASKKQSTSRTSHLLMVGTKRMLRPFFPFSASQKDTDGTKEHQIKSTNLY